jgi:hypothetical protein
MLPGRVRRAMAAGHFRSDLAPHLTFLSLMGMTILPFVARPVAGPVLGLTYDAEFLRRFARHTKHLFLEGVRA